MAAETISVRDLTAAHIGRTFDGKKIIAIYHRGRAVWIFFEGYSPPEGFHYRADGTWPEIELDDTPPGDDLIAVVQWMSGSEDFGPGGQAHETWVSWARPILNAAMDAERQSDPWADVPLPERWVVQFGRDSAIDYTREDSARRSFEGCAPARLVHLSAADAVIVAVKP